MKTSSPLKWWELSTADQIAPRMTIRIVLCFPFAPKANPAPAIEHLKKAVHHTLNLYPFLAGDIVIGKNNEKNGRVNIITNSKLSSTEAVEKVFFVKQFSGTKYPRYSNLKTAGFPAESLCTNDLAPLSCKNSVAVGAPVFLVQANFITGGLLLSVYLHHALCDGSCMAKVLDTLAQGTSTNLAQLNAATSTNKTQLVLKDQEKALPISTDVTARVNQLFEKLSTECVPLRPAHGPWSNRRAVIRHITNPIQTWTFVFKDAMLEKLAARINENNGQNIRVTKNDCMGAIIWIHTIVARLPEHQNLPNNNQSRLMVPVDYRRRIKPAIPDNYFGNAVACPKASIDVKTLIEAASESLSSESIKAFTVVARAIKRAINSVDTNSINRVLELGKILPDVRSLGVNFCCEDLLDVQFNTWAALGADTKWTIPGVPGGENTYAEFVRKSHEIVRHGGNLVLPRRRNAPDWEVNIQLEAPAMARLAGSSVFGEFYFNYYV